MAIPYNRDLNLNQNEIQNGVIQNLSSAPQNPKKGQHYFNTNDNTEYVYNGTAWVDALSQGDYTFQNGVELVTNTRNVQLKIASGGNAGNVTLTADSNGLKGQITELTIDSGSADYLDITNHELSANVDTTVTENSTNLITSGAVSSAIGLALTGALKYKGTWTATSQTDFSSITLPVYKGYMYAVSGSATVGGIEWNAGDYLVINKDIASGGTITSADVDKIDNTEASDILRLNATQTMTNKTINADDNTISNLETDNFKSGVVRTSTDGIRDVSNASDTSIVTEKAIASTLASKIIATTNTALTTSGGVVSWVINNTIGSTSVLVQVFEVATNTQIMAEVIVTSSTITIKMNSASDIASGTYRAVIIG